MPDEVRHELHQMDHLRGAGVGELVSRDGRFRNLQEIGGAVHGVHVLIDHPPHVPALTPQDPFHAQALRLGVDLGVEALHHLVGGEETEIPAVDA